MSNLFTERVLNMAAAVSYTHLDVYKRQKYDMAIGLFYGVGIFLGIGIFFVGGFMTMSGAGWGACLLYTSRCV